jgi:hypothetical protein
VNADVGRKLNLGIVSYMVMHEWEKNIPPKPLRRCAEKDAPLFVDNAENLSPLKYREKTLLTFAQGNVMLYGCPKTV